MFISTEFKKEIKVLEGYDVVVIGGGPAGCAAAAAAAREGARVMLIEATGTLGGMGTSGLVPAWCPFTDGEKFIHNGIAREIFERSNSGIMHLPEEQIHGWIPLDPEELKTIYDNLIKRYSNIYVKLFTTISGVETEGKEIKNIIAASKEGIFAVKAKIYIDCTGDGDVAAFAGAEFEMGNPAIGGIMKTTMCFVLSNVDTYAFMNLSHKKGWGYDSTITGNYLHDGSPVWSIIKSGKYPNVTGFCINLIGPGTVGLNALHVSGVDPTKIDHLTYAMFQGRELAKEHRDALKEFFPEAFSNCYLASTASLMGIRESRRIVGDYMLTYKDYFNRATFDDEICRNSYPVDMHGGMEDENGNLMKTDNEKDFDAFAARMKQTETMGGKFISYTVGESHGIPYKCLTPKGMPNLLVAGRPISVDRIVHASTRVMPNCLSIGEAAGIAAAMASKEACDVHNIDVKRLRKRLKEEGAYQL